MVRRGLLIGRFRYVDVNHFERKFGHLTHDRLARFGLLIVQPLLLFVRTPVLKFRGVLSDFGPERIGLRSVLVTRIRLYAQAVASRDEAVLTVTRYWVLAVGTGRR